MPDLIVVENNVILEQEVVDLEQRLEEAKLRLATQTGTSSSYEARPTYTSLAQLHSLFLLSDSALPLGSFAFSSGLESFLAHQPKQTQTSATFSRFLSLSLSSLAGLTLPYVIAGFETPERLTELDNDFDASTTCTVARRASVKQGRALVAVWERSFRAQFRMGDASQGSHAHAAQTSLAGFAAAVKTAPESIDDFGSFTPNGHLPPLFGVLCAALSMQLGEVLYVYLFNHVKTIVSAGIRASVLGPYQAQGVLASESLRTKINAIISNELIHQTPTSAAGQTVPMMDIWGGRHEIIYSRIFNS
jgi:urease accessory protein